MKIVRWLGNPRSAINGHAVVRVEPAEKAIFEDMVKLLDGPPNFGAMIKLIGMVIPDEWDLKTFDEQGRVDEMLKYNGMGNYPIPEVAKTMIRYFDVFVDRD